MGTSPRTAVRTLTVSRVISLTGGAAAFLALNYTVYDRTGSARWLAASLFLTFGAVGFASPFAGAIGDRFDRRRVMIASDLAGALFFALMTLVHSPAALIALAFAAAVSEAPFLAASTAAIPNLVGEEDIGWANGMIALGRNSGILIGPLLGGALVATVGPSWVFGVNAVSFVISAALVARVRGSFSGTRGEGSEHEGLRAGFRYLAHEPVLRTLALAWTVMVLGLGLTMVADVPLVKLFDTGSWGYGALISAWGGGSVVGSLMGRKLREANEAPVFVLGTAAVALTAVAIGLSPWFAVVIVAGLVMGVGDSLSLVAQQGLLQRRTPDAVRSRVSGAFDSVIHIGLALSYVVGGAVVGVLGPRASYVAGGAASAVAVFIALPAIRAARAGRGEAAEVATERETAFGSDAAGLILE